MAPHRNLKCRPSGAFGAMKHLSVPTASAVGYVLSSLRDLNDTTPCAGYAIVQSRMLWQHLI
jgi:hypothetical protein